MFLVSGTEFPCKAPIVNIRIFYIILSKILYIEIEIRFKKTTIYT